MHAVISMVVFFSLAFQASWACVSCPSCPQKDLERDFCSADIVLRARILTGPEQEVTSEDDNAPPLSSYDPDDVYSVKIVKIFKGKENATQLLGIKSIGVRSPNLVIDFHTPARWWKMCIPSLIDLEHGHEYLLSGFIDEGKLRSSYCDMRYSWTSVAHRQRKGLNGQFHNNC